jgi:FKBP-type peptidyl-prolyl cis-trans isomerase
MGEDKTDKEALVNRLLAVVGLAALMACGGSGNGASDTPTGPTSLQIEDVVVGTGATVVAGDTITINYVGTFLDGRVFDQSPAGQPVTFPRPIGQGNFIPGFDQGLLGMKVGGRRKLTIPSSLAYGSAGAPPTIPPNTPLAFDVTLVGIAGK